MKVGFLVLVGLALTSCASVHTNDRYGFTPGPGMNEDGQDRSNTKYNFMDSPDGRQDPNAQYRIWGATY